MPLLWSFLVRDFYEETSYRLSFVLGLISMAFNAVTFFFLSEAFGDKATATVQGIEVDYFPFVLIGLAFNAYFTVGLNGFGNGIRRAQQTGTLEAMLMSPTPLSLIVIGSSLWSYTYTTFRMFIYLMLGAFLGVSFVNVNLLSALVTMILSLISFASIGIMAAGIIMVIKRGEPLTALMGYFGLLLGGVYYSVESLPQWLQFLGRLLPITYALEAIRASLLFGATLADIQTQLIALLIFCVLLFPTALYVFRYAVQQARADGTLTHY